MITFEVFDPALNALAMIAVRFGVASERSGELD
jgi:hypothetical protein